MLNNPAKFQVVASGRRSYKTELKKRKLIIGTKHHPGALTLPNSNFFFAAPTHQQAKRIAWADLKYMTQPYWSNNPNETEKTIHLFNGSTIHVVGMEASERIEGMMWHGGVLDEYGNMKPEVWTEHIEPVTIDTGAWIDFIGVPEGKNHYFELYMYASSKSDPNWAAFSWKSADIIDSEYIERAKRQLPERAFKQEYEAQFVDESGLVYYSYSQSNYSQKIFDPSLNTYLCWDFNVNPLSCIIVQKFSDEEYVAVKEFVIDNTNTREVAEIVDDYLQKQKFNGKLYIRGDATGRYSKSSATFSDYYHIQQTFKKYDGYTEPGLRVTRRQKDRTDALNAMFCNSEGKRKLFINTQQCPRLHRDLLITEWKQGGVHIDKRPGVSDPSDALSYFAYYDFPVRDDFSPTKVL